MKVNYDHNAHVALGKNQFDSLDLKESILSATFSAKHLDLLVDYLSLSNGVVVDWSVHVLTLTYDPEPLETFCAYPIGQRPRGKPKTPRIQNSHRRAGTASPGSSGRGLMDGWLEL